MKKTIGYWIEKLSGYFLGCIVMAISYEYWDKFKFIYNAQFLEKIISISTTLFGFLLTILTLIVQSNSPTVANMKQHGSYRKLILFNKTIVIACISNCILSLALSFTQNLFISKCYELFEFATILNIGIFTVALFNTIIFTLIFYKILISGE